LLRAPLERLKEWPRAPRRRRTRAPRSAPRPPPASPGWRASKCRGWSRWSRGRGPHRSQAAARPCTPSSLCPGAASWARTLAVGRAVVWWLRLGSGGFDRRPDAASAFRYCPRSGRS